MKKVVFIFIALLISIGLGYLFALLHPAYFYQHQKEVGQATIHSCEVLPPSSESIVREAISIVSSCPLYDSTLAIDLCINDGSRYIDLHPYSSGIAYSFSNKSVFYWAKPDFDSGLAYYHAFNERRQVDLKWLIAHEFIHNYQYHYDWLFMTKVPFWIQEGYAEYYSRSWAKDDKLCQRIAQVTSSQYIDDKSAVHLLPDSTCQNNQYFKYGTLVGYMIEVEELSFSDMYTVNQDINYWIKAARQYCEVR